MLTWLGLGGALLAGGVAAAVAAGRRGVSVRDLFRQEPSQNAIPAASVPDLMARTRAARAATNLYQLDALAATLQPRAASLLRRMAADHLAHLRALGAAPPATATPAATTAPGATPTAGTGPSRQVAAHPSSVIAAEWAAARTALTDVGTTGPGMATLLARLAACRAVHADLLRRRTGQAPLGLLQPAPAATAAPTAGAAAPTGSAAASADGAIATAGDAAAPAATPSPLPSAAGQAFAALLAGEHAAVFAYGVLTARATSSHQALARDLWAEHRQARDTLAALLVAHNETPPAADPAYDVGPMPTTQAQVTALAVRVEKGLATVAAVAVAQSEGDLRRLAAGYLVAAARRSAGWTGSTDALPGLR